MLRPWLSELSRRLAKRLQALAERLSDAKPAEPPGNTPIEPVPEIDPAQPPEHWLRLVEARSPQVAAMFARRQPRRAAAARQPEASSSLLPTNRPRSDSPAAGERRSPPLDSLPPRESHPSDFTPFSPVLPTEKSQARSAAGRLGPVNDEAVSKSRDGRLSQNESAKPRENVTAATAPAAPTGSAGHVRRKAPRLYPLVRDAAEENFLGSRAMTPSVYNPFTSKAVSKDRQEAQTRSMESNFPRQSLPPTTLAPAWERAVARNRKTEVALPSSPESFTPRPPSPSVLHPSFNIPAPTLPPGTRRDNRAESQVPPSVKPFVPAPAVAPRWADLLAAAPYPSPTHASEMLEDAERRRHLELDQRG